MSTASLTVDVIFIVWSDRANGFLQIDEHRPYMGSRPWRNLDKRDTPVDQTWPRK